MMPPNLQHQESFDRSQLSVDFTALAILESCQDDVQNDHHPILTRGDGNCLFNALSISVCGSERLTEEIRVRTCVEMVLNKEYYNAQEYAKDFFFVSESYDDSCRQCAAPGRYSSPWIIQAASDALCRDIYSVYPKMNGKSDQTAKILTRVCVFILSFTLLSESTFFKLVATFFLRIKPTCVCYFLLKSFAKNMVCHFNDLLVSLALFHS